MSRTRRLRIGEIVRHDNGLWRVDLVNPCRARLVPLDRRRVRFHDYGTDGEVEFDGVASRPISICPDSDIERVSPAELEDIMATKKATKKPATEKKPRAAAVSKEDLCTFAIRIPKAESAAIHKAAGPGGATKWARAILAAAAKGDVEAVRAALGA